jgi:aryl-alcohol dehydrogenase-like predicted oxidoreductase
MPYQEETYGRSEEIVGEWLRYFQARDKVVISTKVCGRSDHLTYCRGSPGLGTRVTQKQVVDAVDASLRRLGTDYIDVLHLNWPERYVPLFGYPKYEYDGEVSNATPIEEQIQIFADLIKAGKIRHYGLSNETPFGVTSFLILAKRLGLPAPVVVQNTYNLIDRNDFESGMVEACSPLHGGVGLLAAAPLAGGALTGKYISDKYSESAKNEFRMRKHLGFMYPYITPGAEAAIKEYLQVAAEYDIPLNLMALSFVCSRPFVTSTLIGATNSAQLEENVLSLNIPMTREIEKEFEAIYRRHVDPAKGEFEIIDPCVEREDIADLPWGIRSEEVDPGLEALMDARMGQWEDDAEGAGDDEEEALGLKGEGAALGDVEGLPFGEAQVD